LKLKAPKLAAVPAAILKGLIVSLGNTGLITAEQATLLLAVLELHDA
jgi:hypothetical protein